MPPAEAGDIEGPSGQLEGGAGIGQEIPVHGREKMGLVSSHWSFQSRATGSNRIRIHTLLYLECVMLPGICNLSCMLSSPHAGAEEIALAEPAPLAEAAEEDTGAGDEGIPPAEEEGGFVAEAEPAVADDDAAFQESPAYAAEAAQDMQEQLQDLSQSQDISPQGIIGGESAAGMAALTKGPPPGQSFAGAPIPGV